MKVQVALPERWRMEMMLAPSVRLRTLESLADSRYHLEVMDWNDSLASAEAIIIAGLDLSTAELAIKLPKGKRVVGILNTVSESSRFAMLWPYGGRRRLLVRARSRQLTWIEPRSRPKSVPADLLAYLLPAVDTLHES